MRNPGMRKTGFTLIELLVVVAVLGILAAIAIPNYLDAQIRSKVARVKSDQRTVTMALETFNQDHNTYPHPFIYCEYHPVDGHPGPEVREAEWLSRVRSLSTPVAYLSTTMLTDPFIRAKAHTHSSHGYLPLVSHLPPEPPTVIMPNLISGPGGESRDPTKTYMFAVCDFANSSTETFPNRFPYYRIEDTEKHRPRYFIISVGPDAMSGPDFISGMPWPANCYVCGNDHTGENRFIQWHYDPSNGTISAGDIFHYELPE